MTDEQIKSLEGADPAQVVEALYDGVQALLYNDPDYFSEGRSNSVVHTLRQLIALIEG